MGRYYNGDIEGKFWFGVQDSTDAEQFGATPEEPTELYYYADNLKKCQSRIEEIKKELGENLEKLQTFFSSVEGYTDEEVKGLIGEGYQKALQLYASLELGLKIEKCIIEKGKCSFVADL